MAKLRDKYILKKLDRMMDKYGTYYSDWPAWGRRLARTLRRRHGWGGDIGFLFLKLQQKSFCRHIFNLPDESAFVPSRESWHRQLTKSKAKWDAEAKKALAQFR